jgi:F0F1-type ATP synthase assembly protein I
VFNKKLDFLVSEFFGGMSALIPNLVFAIRFFKRRSVESTNKANKLLNNMYFAEVLKFVLVFGCLIASFNNQLLNPVAIVISFIFVCSSVPFTAMLAVARVRRRFG